MELIFIRHGQSEHTLSIPESLHLRHPSLTRKGRSQAELLRSRLPLSSADVLLVSPTLRTLQTALIWSGNVKCVRMVHPFVAPRIFPARLFSTTLACDELLDLVRIQNEFPSFVTALDISSPSWTTGINILAEVEFNLLAEEFISFCRSFNRERIYIVTHDGTITSYRQKNTGRQLTRDDFLQETEWYRLIVK